MKRILITALVSLIFTAKIIKAEELEDPAIPGIGQIKVFEALNGFSITHFGYSFTISPDEKWILVHDIEKGFILYYIPSGKAWQYMIDRMDLWYPNCFSSDSQKLYFKNMAADISAGMEKLDFRITGNVPVMNTSNGRCLGFTGVLKDNTGRWAPRWSSSLDYEGKNAFLDWSYDGKIMYEAKNNSTARTKENSYIEITPPGIKKNVDFSELIKVISEEKGEMFGETSDGMTPEQAESMAFLKDMMFNPNMAFYLRNISVSPDGNYLAATTDYEYYSVLIPLGGETLKAYPFAKDVADKMIWSDDSKRLYYYGLTTRNPSRGTVHRLKIGGLK